jgi:hypothetical protein
MKPAVIVLFCLCFSVASAARNDAPKFYDDDPLIVEPITQDASGAVEREIDLFFDLLMNTFALDRTPVDVVRAQNVNTIDEVPDSGWFTNRVLKRAITPDELTMGPARAGDGPAEGPWVIVAAKSAGAAPGFTVRDAEGETWFIQFDSPGYGEAATGAVVVANRLFHAIGYWQVDQYISVLRPERLTIGETARMRRPSGEKTRMTKDDLAAIFANADRRQDGSYRVRLLRHAVRRPQRHRPARASPRVARAEGVRGLGQPRRPEGREHARHGHHRKRTVAHPPLPAGRRFRLRHRRERPAPLG